MVVGDEGHGPWGRYVLVHRVVDVVEVVLGGQVSGARDAGDGVGVDAALGRDSGSCGCGDAHAGARPTACTWGKGWAAGSGELVHAGCDGLSCV